MSLREKGVMRAMWWYETRINKCRRKTKGMANVPCSWCPRLLCHVQRLTALPLAQCMSWQVHWDECHLDPRGLPIGNV